jgi:hypothetical protein
VVDASSKLGINGTVIIRSPETDLSSSLTDLPESFLNVAALLREPCAVRNNADRSSFIVRGRAAIPPGPAAPLPLFGTTFSAVDSAVLRDPAGGWDIANVAGLAELPDELFLAATGSGCTP